MDLRVKIVLAFFVAAFICCQNSASEKNKKAIITYYANQDHSNPIEADTVKYTLTNDIQQNYIYKLFHDNDTVYKLIIEKNFDKLIYLRKGSHNSQLINTSTYWVAGKYYNVYLYIINDVHYPLYIAFTPKMGVLATKSSTGNELFEYPDESYYLTAKALSLNAISDSRLWHPNDTILSK